MKHTALSRNPSSQHGFTMIELLVAATIIAVLTTIGLVSFSSANIRARDGKRKADMEQVRSALELYRSDSANGLYPVYTPSSYANFNAMVSALYSGQYISTNTLTDPKNVSPYQYRYTATGSPVGKGYQVCATLEASGPVDYCLTNP